MRTSVTVLIGAVITIFATYPACKTIDTSAARHDAGHLADSKVPPWSWLDLTLAEHVAGVEQAGKRAGDEPLDALSEDDPLTVRAEFWIRQIDALVRPKDSAIPQPHAIISRQPVANAFVSGLLALYKVSLKRPADAGGGRLGLGPIASFDAGGKLICQPARSDDFIVKTMPPIIGMLEYFADESRTGECRLTILSRAPLTIDFTDQCPYGGCSGYHSAQGLVQSGTSNYVTFYAGAITALEEDEFVAVVAHELVHYYRGHAVLWSLGERGDGYPYRVDQKNFGRKPAKDASLEQKLAKFFALNTKVEEFLKNRMFGSRQFSNFVLSKVNGSFRQANAAQLCTAEQECSTACHSYFQYTSDAAAAINYYDARSQEDKFAQNFAIRNRFDELAQNCLSRLTVDHVLAHTNGLEENLSPYVNIPELRSGSFWEVVLALDKSWEDEGRRILAEYDVLAREGIAYYSDEQEADEGAAENLARLGIDPKAAVSALMKMLKISDIERDEYWDSLNRELAKTNNALSDKQRAVAEKERLAAFRGLDHSTCEALRIAGWKGPDGQLVPIPLGDLTDTHHSFCFRAYSLSQDIAAHAFQVTGRRPTTLEPSWREIQRLAAAAAQAAP